MWFVNCELYVKIVSCHGQNILIDIFGVHFKQFKSENCTPIHRATILTPFTPAPTRPPPVTLTRCDVTVSQPWQAVYLFSQPQKCSLGKGREGQQILLLVFWNSGEMEKKSEGVRKRGGGSERVDAKVSRIAKTFVVFFYLSDWKFVWFVFWFFQREPQKGKEGNERDRERGVRATFEVINLKCNFLISQADKKLWARHLPRTKLLLCTMML